MKSKATFDIDYENRPIIIAQATYTDDVRDKIAARFKESFSQRSNLCVVSFLPDQWHIPESPTNTMHILPLSPFEPLTKSQLGFVTNEQMEYLIKIFTEVIEQRKELDTPKEE
jgi:hypothetical protein